MSVCAGQTWIPRLAESEPKKLAEGTCRTSSLFCLPTTTRAPRGPSPAASGSGSCAQSTSGPDLSPGSFLPTLLKAPPPTVSPPPRRGAGPEQVTCPHPHSPHCLILLTGLPCVFQRPPLEAAKLWQALEQLLWSYITDRNESCF